MTTNHHPQQLISEVQLFRIRVATAESELKVIREQAREAKRQRKEAKQIARRAKRQFKRSKAELFELKEALTKAEGELSKVGGRLVKLKMPKAALSKKAKSNNSKVRTQARPQSQRPGRARGAKAIPKI